MLIGSVTKLLSGASMVPTMPAVATNTVLLPPASACVTASTSALRRARRSPAATSTTGCARADIRALSKIFRVERILLAADSRTSHCAERRSEVQRTWMADHHRACLLRPRCADLAERRFHLVDHEIDHVKWTFRAERTEAPQKGLAGERGIGPERDCPHPVEARAHAAVQHHGRPAADGAGNG